LAQTAGQHSHYRFLDTRGLTGSVLEISDAKPGQAGIYEVILKSGVCEIRNLIQVNVGTELGGARELAVCLLLSFIYINITTKRCTISYCLRGALTCPVANVTSLRKLFR
jgi:hypothetical protein